MFKSGAVRIEKIADGTDGPQIPEQQTAAVERAAQKHDAASAPAVEDYSRLERQMELWLCETYETTAQLLEIYEKLIPQLIHHDQEVEGGLRVLHGLAEGMRARLEPHVRRLGEDKQRGRHRAHILGEALFPHPAVAGEDSESPSIAYEVLEALQGLAVYLSHIESSLTALQPVALAMWDDEFDKSVTYAQQCVHRMLAWVRQQIKVRSPQTLLVPIVPKGS
ncbi:MAG: hypothetical protein JWP44_4452 [Mucilaginibacter sp.]|jgi:ferredoxin-nitrate reductase|nr:hypothetical protein [Mucilaginibacter sp.]